MLYKATEQVFISFQCERSTNLVLTFKGTHSINLTNVNTAVIFRKKGVVYILGTNETHTF